MNSQSYKISRAAACDAQMVGPNDRDLFSQWTILGHCHASPQAPVVHTGVNNGQRKFLNLQRRETSCSDLNSYLRTYIECAMGSIATTVTCFCTYVKIGSEQDPALELVLKGVPAQSPKYGTSTFAVT